jgi:hypothetical protein
MKEKRKTGRAPLDIYLNKYVSGVPYMARTSNISPEGVSLSQLIEPQHLCKKVGLQFQLPGSAEVIYAEGEVVREWAESKHEGSGVRFTLLSQRHRQMISAFVEHNHT